MPHQPCIPHTSQSRVPVIRQPDVPGACECAWCETGLSGYRVGPLTRPRMMASSRAPRRRALAVALVGLTLLALAAGGQLARAPAAGHVGVAPGTASPTTADGPTMPPDRRAAGHGCPIAGDLVWSPEGTNGGNPVEVARALCGR